MSKFRGLSWMAANILLLSSTSQTLSHAQLANPAVVSSSSSANTAILLNRTTVTANLETPPPQGVSDGQPHDISITLKNCTATDGNDYAKWTVQSPKGSGVTVTTSPFSPPPECKYTGTVTVPSGTKSGNLTLTIVNDKKKKSATVRLVIVAPKLPPPYLPPPPAEPSPVPPADGNKPLTGELMPAVHLRDGKPFQILINLKGCTDSNKADFAKLTVEPLVGSGLVIQGKPAFASCALTATLVADPSTPPGKLPLQLKEGDVTKGLVFIDIVDAVPGPIPPGLAPQVDVLWNVLDGHITEDTFGGWVNKRYYAVEVVIGNNTGFQLQIASVGFNLHNFKGEVKALTDNSDQLAQWRHAPTNDYHVVRATPEKEQIAGPRASVINTAEAIALLGSGITPFFKNVGHRATYSTTLTLLGNPVSKGISLIWPDLTVPDLNRLDNLALHDNAIVPNNTQTRTIVFIDRHVLSAYFARQRNDHSKDGWGPGAKKGDTTTYDNANTQITEDGPCQGAIKPQRYWLKKIDRRDKGGTRPLCNSDEPEDVKYWLGELILVGDEIEYRQRIYLGTNQSQTTASKITISPSDVVNTVLANLGAKVTLTLAGGDLSTLPTGKISVNPQLNLALDAAGTDKTTRTGTLTSVTQVPALSEGAQALAIPVSGVDHQVVSINVKQQQMKVTPNSSPQADLKKNGGLDVEVTTVDGDLSKFGFDTLPTGIVATGPTPAPDGKNPAKTITFKLTATGNITTPVVLKDKQTSAPVITITN